GRASWIARGARCISTAQFTASTTLQKICQQAVASGADDPPAMRRDQRVDGAPQFTERAMCAGLVLAHQAAEADDVRVQNGSEFSFPRAACWDISHRPPHRYTSRRKGRTSRTRLTPPLTMRIIFGSAHNNEKS